MTPSQLEAARAWLAENWSIAPDLRDLTEEGVERTVQEVAALLSATAPPSEEELSQEAAALRNAGAVKEATAMGWPPYRALYIAGARRRGRK
jgi:hypothetical protein